MKSKWEKIQELYKNKYTKPLLFFGFYFIFFTVIIVTFAFSPSTSNNDITEKNLWDDITNNYEYLYEIETSNNIITLEGKHYGNKNLLTKKINDDVTDEIYIFYNDMYIKSSNEWIINNNYELVDDAFDNRLLSIDYIKSLVGDSEKINSITNFDESITDKYQFGNINIEVISSNNELRKIKLYLPLYKINLQYKNINRVQDFVVEK
jgi:hypothetical protein